MICLHFSLFFLHFAVTFESGACTFRQYYLHFACTASPVENLMIAPVLAPIATLTAPMLALFIILLALCPHPFSSDSCHTKFPVQEYGFPPPATHYNLCIPAVVKYPPLNNPLHYIFPSILPLLSSHDCHYLTRKQFP